MYGKNNSLSLETVLGPNNCYGIFINGADKCKVTNYVSERKMVVTLICIPS
jgi:hypothetical protein